MGYTHYWYNKPELDKDKFAKFVNATEKIIAECKRLGVEIDYGKTYGYIDDGEIVGYKDGVTSPDYVFFNGVDEKAHEAFVIQQNTPEQDRMTGAKYQDKVFSFCKTARKPYDIAVVACLIAFKHIFGVDVIVLSDGDNEDWAGGKRLCQEVMGFGIQYEMKDELEEVIDINYGKLFPIASVSRADLEEARFNTNNVSDATMLAIADKMASDYVEHLYWDSLEIIATEMGFEKEARND